MTGSEFMVRPRQWAWWVEYSWRQRLWRFLRYGAVASGRWVEVSDQERQPPRFDHLIIGPDVDLKKFTLQDRKL